MQPNELYEKLLDFFSNTNDLMRHLHINACWKYVIVDNSISESEIARPKLSYYLYKKEEDNLKMTIDDPNIEPDLILYFTEQAVLQLIDGHPSAEEYYRRYREVMDNPKSGIEVDNKINKARLKLWRLGYRNWQNDFNF
ncbi:MAG: hypothetical protein GF383_00280 [Candidatus Lokiarchaeota archaeon]|nr:hypothetical protein [Candidatus Lokiarchaeota archaeon]MBD3337547.1 hypothetical protein [Candidatus Lokiarchaeota archaeon]